jgi:ADP-ribose pyrophosphatase YjhB (NUDIX family)
MGEARAEDPVADARRFCRFQPGGSPAEGYWEAPPDGMCLSSFLVLSPKGHPDRVLVGRIDPAAPWMRIGALDPRRVRLNASGWMLPSCQLLYFESPEAAARRVLDEQLGLGDVELEPPIIVSESYRSPRHPERRQHWDLEFLFRGALPAPEPPRHAAWVELRYVTPAETPRRAFTRSHEEILENAGFHIGL